MLKSQRHAFRTLVRVYSSNMQQVMYFVELSYPAPIFVELDEYLSVLAQRYAGRWFGSSVALAGADAERDIEFHFKARKQAEEFAAKCACVVGVRVLKVEPIVENSA